MDLNKLATAIANKEGKKHQATIGDIREIIRIIVDFEAAALVDRSATSPCVMLKISAMEFARRMGYFGGKSAKSGSRTKVSKENKIKAGRDRKTKCASKGDRRPVAKARK